MLGQHKAQGSWEPLLEPTLWTLTMARGITILALHTLPPKPWVNDSPAAAGTWGSDDEEQIISAKSPIHESNRDASDNTYIMASACFPSKPSSSIALSAISVDATPHPEPWPHADLEPPA
ncbi:hypothetical protein I7I51_01238, partial [Histoplasma capsulatum]